MMKRVMSAPVGASRASQQQPGHSSSGAGSIGTAAFHPRSPNVALDPVRRILFCICFLSILFICLFLCSSNPEAARAAAAALVPASTAKYPVPLKVFATGRGQEGGQAVVADFHSCTKAPQAFFTSVESLPL